MVDIGGGSTEMVTGNMGKVTSLTSLNIGCVRITERFLQMTDQEKRKDSIEVLTAVKAARSHIRQLLEETIREFPLFSKARSLVAVAGTVSALARADLKIKTHDEQKTHHHVLKKEFVEEMAKLLPTLSLEERVTKLYIEEARADVILGGVLILEQIMDILEQKEALVSEKDILDATASSLL